MQRLPPARPFAILAPDLAYTIDGSAQIASRALHEVHAKRDTVSALLHAPSVTRPTGSAEGDPR